MSQKAKIPKSVIEEFLEISLLIKPIIPRFVDGKDAITTMKQNGSPNWRQMEWIGWWFEYFVESEIRPALGNTLGPKFGNTTFDIKLKYVWDLKAHPMHKDDLILNDQKAIQECTITNDGLGFIILEGEVLYDDDQESFKNWHDSIKGKQSKYVDERIARNAPSRRRKKSFKPSSLFGIWIDSIETLENGLKTGWVGDFQKDMRNSNGNPRKAKYKFNTSKIPTENIVANIPL